MCTCTDIYMPTHTCTYMNTRRHTKIMETFEIRLNDFLIIK